MGLVKVLHFNSKPIDGILDPFIPKNHLIRFGHADGVTPRIAVYPSIYWAMFGIHYKRPGRKLWINYAIVDEDDLYTPLHRESPRALISREKWLLKPTEFHPLERIQLIEPAGRVRYNYAMGKSAYLYEYWWYTLITVNK